MTIGIDWARTHAFHCRNCGVKWTANPGQCPKPSPGRELVDTGVGGHMFSLTEDDVIQRERAEWEETWRPEMGVP